MPIRILLADDHRVVRQGLRMFLGLDAELQVLGEAADGAEAVRLAEQLQPDVILMDLVMPVMSGLEATTAIRQKNLPPRVIVLTSVIEEAAVSAVFRAGADGYLLKDTEADELCRAIKAVAAGQTTLSPRIAARLLAETRAGEGPEVLTDRESAVLQLAAEGLSDEQIAERLTVTQPVVQGYLNNILDKLRLANQAQAALLDFSNQLLNHPEGVALMDRVVQTIPMLLHTDACAVLLPGDEPGHLVVAAASGWPGDPVAERVGVRLDPAHGPGWVMRTQQPWQAADLATLGNGSANGAGSADEPWHREGFRSLALIPLQAEGRAIGVLALTSCRPRRWDEDELVFLRLLANQAALIIEQARLYQAERQQQAQEEDLSVARQIQLGLLPEKMPQAEGWEFAAAYDAARQVGGDLYDFVELPGSPRRVGLLIADVSGKGASAALFMAHSQAVIRAIAAGTPSPARTLGQANDLIIKNNQTGHFVSAFYAVLEPETGRLTYANAGHNWPLWWRAATGDFQRLAGRDLVLGVKTGISFEERQVDLGAGDLVVLYTDGITEAMNDAEELFDEPRLRAAVQAHAAAGPAAVVAAVVGAVKDFSGGAPQADDITLVVFGRAARGAGAEPGAVSGPPPEAA
jgi:sigma-B regulation protein RsbU (phosphoserine phosphatase)